MDALRKFASNTVAATSAMVSSRTDDLSRQQGRSGAATGYSNVRRRLYESALQAAGRSAATDDSMWAERHSAMEATEKQLASLLAYISKHQAAARTLAGACADLGGELRALYSVDTGGGLDGSVGTVAAALAGVDEGARREVSRLLVRRRRRRPA
jgi:hypothetical protein